MNQIDQSILNHLRELDSATVFNAMGEVEGYANEDYTGPEIKYMLPEMGAIIGYAVTVEATPLDPTPPELSWDAFYDYMADLSGPIVTVFKDVDPRPNRAAIFGDGMAHLQKALGVVGAVVDGCVRDLDGIRAAGLPVFGRGLVPGHGPFHVRGFKGRVTVGQLTVNNGELLFGDTDGIVKIPAHKAEDILVAAQKIRDRERAYFDLCDSPDFDYSKVKAWKESS